MARGPDKKGSRITSQSAVLRTYHTLILPNMIFSLSCGTIIALSIMSCNYSERSCAQFPNISKANRSFTMKMMPHFILIASRWVKA